MGLMTFQGSQLAQALHFHYNLLFFFGVNMPKCSAFGCNYPTKSKDNPSISLHNFPKSGKLRKRWIKVTQCIRLSKDPSTQVRCFIVCPTIIKLSHLPSRPSKKLLPFIKK